MDLAPLDLRFPMKDEEAVVKCRGPFTSRMAVCLWCCSYAWLLAKLLTQVRTVMGGVDEAGEPGPDGDPYLQEAGGRGLLNRKVTCGG